LKGDAGQAAINAPCPAPIPHRHDADIDEKSPCFKPAAGEVAFVD